MADLKYGPLPAAEDLNLPRSHADRWDVALASQRPGMAGRAMAAALGMSWPRYRQEHPYLGDVVAYGGAVVDRLLEAGYDYGSITDAGIPALKRVNQSLAPVEGAADFSGPPAADGPASGGASSDASS